MTTQNTFFDPALLNQGFAVLVRITAKPGEEAAIAAILDGLTAPSNAEADMICFMPYRSADNPAEFFVYELYRSEAGWAAHNAAPHFRAVVDDLVARAEHRTRLPFQPFVTSLPSASPA